jgi:HPt (histidine-containing phosphotransfer) domain-containing protein
VSDTPISDSTAHTVGDLGMLCRRLERKLAATRKYLSEVTERVKQLETENDAMRADLLLWRDTTDAMCSKAGIGFTTEDKP